MAKSLAIVLFRIIKFYFIRNTSFQNYKILFHEKNYATANIDFTCNKMLHLLKLKIISYHEKKNV